METPWAYPSALLTNTLTFRSNTVKWNESLHWHRQWINLMELFVLLVREKTLCEVVRSQTKRIKLNPPILESYKLINNKAEWKKHLVTEGSVFGMLQRAAICFQGSKISKFTAQLQIFKNVLHIELQSGHCHLV